MPSIPDLLYDHRHFNLSRKASINFPEPTDQSSFRGVQIHHQNRSSVLRSRVNRLLNLTNSTLVLNRKIVFSMKKQVFPSQLNCMVDGRLSMFHHVILTIFQNLLKGSLTFLYMRSGPSCLNGKMCSNSMFRSVINYL